MTALSPLFLWLIPLALLPVIIHLLNRLRYQTVQWAAMMFLRSADRDASRRAKIRQWLILAARCLMLLMFLLALARLQSKGGLARFFDSGSNLVIILFDRSASMEQSRGGVSGRERALRLLSQGLSELGPGARVIWMDSVTGELMPLPNGIDLERLPMVQASDTSSDLSGMLRSALQEIARAGVSKAEVWIPTDRQASAWLPDGANPPDWSEWEGMTTQVTLRLLDVAQVQRDPGNRSLQVRGEPQWNGQELALQMRLYRDRADAESVPLQIDFGGLSLREELMVEGQSFTWEQMLPVSENQTQLHAEITLPADSNPADNRIAVSWKNSGAILVSVESGDVEVDRVMSAALLPQPGLREPAPAGSRLDENIDVKVSELSAALSAEEQKWVEEGGILLQVPSVTDLVAVGEDDYGVGIESWEEISGVLSTEQREPLRMDLVRVFEAVDLPESGVSLAELESGTPFLTREVLGEGVVYRLATLPIPDASNLDAGYVLVPMLQRMLLEGGRMGGRFGTHALGDVDLGVIGEWSSMGDPEASPLLNVGRYRAEGGVLALNRKEQEDRRETLSVIELKEWAEPLDLRVFEDRTEVDTELTSRFEYTSLLLLLAFVFLVIESWLLTLNVRRPSKKTSAWSVA